MIPWMYLSPEIPDVKIPCLQSSKYPTIFLCKISKALLDLWAFEIFICNLRQIYDFRRHQNNLKKTYSALFVEFLYLATLRFCHFQQQKTFHNYVY